jgi:hypothetical protein
MADLTTLLSKFLQSLDFFSGRVSGVLTTTTASAGTAADTNETDLWTYSLPANVLNANGKTVRITAFGTLAANANSKTPRLYFGGTLVAFNTVLSNNQGWRLTADVVRTGASAQLASGLYAGGAGNGFLANLPVTPAASTTAAITIKVTGQNGTASANDIVFLGAVVELLN